MTYLQEKEATRLLKRSFNILLTAVTVNGASPPGVRQGRFRDTIAQNGARCPGLRMSQMSEIVGSSSAAAIRH